MSRSGYTDDFVCDDNWAMVRFARMRAWVISNILPEPPK